MEENFSMEWYIEWKIFIMEWERKKIASVEYGKIIFHYIPYHALVPEAKIPLFENCSTKPPSLSVPLYFFKGNTVH